MAYTLARIPVVIIRAILKFRQNVSNGNNPSNCPSFSVGNLIFFSTTACFQPLDASLEADNVVVFRSCSESGTTGSTGVTEAPTQPAEPALLMLPLPALPTLATPDRLIVVN